ncbi:extracellular serine-rich protein [Metarhizium album ARSEF 1941]|uniref:Extracellular serine-rich protein n=1 Tax=Metarhizium album (strain ARSEF 1941) TaxID=1081103 RepID=A0A0B2X979_METAS|nr:extracellular serine-rich protein [Metarhizium album ARSEF 1941]KHO01861.1 extracellular serine-rich protein [Metarhizium album ARSEF 1941]
MHFTTLSLTTLLAAAQAAVNVHVVAVGKNPSTNETALRFFPSKITAQPGDMVQFQFWAGNHSVAQSGFDHPCVPIASVNASKPGFYSSFQPAEAGVRTGRIPVYTIVVNNTQPMWVYCSQTNHCQKKMSMVINENTAANTSRSLENYQSGSAVSSKSPSAAPSAPSAKTAPLSAGDSLAVPSTLLLLAIGVGFTSL